MLHSWVNIDHLVTVLTGMTTTLYLNKCISMYKQHLDITICLQGLNFLHSRYNMSDQFDIFIPVNMIFRDQSESSLELP